MFIKVCMAEHIWAKIAQYTHKRAHTRACIFLTSLTNTKLSGYWFDQCRKLRTLEAVCNLVDEAEKGVEEKIVHFNDYIWNVHDKLILLVCYCTFAQIFVPTFAILQSSSASILKEWEGKWARRSSQSETIQRTVWKTGTCSTLFIVISGVVTKVTQATYSAKECAGGGPVSIDFKNWLYIGRQWPFEIFVCVCARARLDAKHPMSICIYYKR